MTNTELAYLLNVSPSMASRLRSGDRLPSPTVMVEMRRAFAVSGDDLLTAYGRGATAFGRLMRRLLKEHAA